MLLPARRSLVGGGPSNEDSMVGRGLAPTPPSAALRAPATSPSLRDREERLPERVEAAVVVVDVERRIGDDRRQANARADAGLGLVAASHRIDVDQDAIGAR